MRKENHQTHKHTRLQEKFRWKSRDHEKAYFYPLWPKQSIIAETLVP